MSKIGIQRGDETHYSTMWTLNPYHVAIQLKVK